MTETYRPVLNRKTARAVSTVIRKGMEQVELSNEDTRLVLLFLNKITEWDTMAAFLERLDKRIPDVDESYEPPIRPVVPPSLEEKQSVTMFTDWDDESLRHFLIANPEDEKAVWVQEELIRRARTKEQQNPQRIRPPQSNPQHD